MSEICLECLNKITGRNETEAHYVISRDLDLCEECGQYKRVVIKERLWFRIEQALRSLFDKKYRSRR